MNDPHIEEPDCEVNEEFNKLAMNDEEEVRVDDGMNEEKTGKKKRKRVSKNRKTMVFWRECDFCCHTHSVTYLLLIGDQSMRPCFFMSK